jgi:DNA processing protein
MPPAYRAIQVQFAGIFTTYKISLSSQAEPNTFVHMADDDLLYKVALSMLPGVGGMIGKQLLAYCGSPKAVFSMSKSKLLRVQSVGEKLVEVIQDKSYLLAAEKELKFIEKEKISVLFISDEGYPVRLKDCADSSLTLFYKGNANLNLTKAIAIVGTRNASPYGRKFIQELMESWNNESILIVSGLAYGIDTIAHKYALANKLPTIGVLGHGLHTLYPAQNKNLSRQMLEHGGLLSDLPSNAKMVPGNFPRRNRIVAGMVDAVLVVETAVRGGAVITADIANSYNRDVFAVPGPIEAAYSRGCHDLIKTHRAALVENGEDILKALNWDQEAAKPAKQGHLWMELNADEQAIINRLREEPGIPIDLLMRQVPYSSGEIATLLLELELKGIIVSLPGKRFKMNH